FSYAYPMTPTSSRAITRARRAKKARTNGCASGKKWGLVRVIAAPPDDPRREEWGGSPPPRTPKAPVHGGALLRLGRVEPLLGELLLQRETLVLRVRLWITHVEAIAAVRVRVAVDQVPVLRLRHDLERR